MIKKHMKKMVMAILVAGVMIINPGNINASTGVDMNKVERHYNVRVFVDSADNEVVFPAGMGKPFIALDRTYVPYRILAERMGASVDWIDSERKVKAQNEKNTVEMVIDNKNYKMNGKTKQMEVEPFILAGEDRTYVPARFLTEGLGYTIEFKQGGRVMYICSFTKNQNKEDIDKIMNEIVEKIEGKPNKGKGNGELPGLDASEVIVKGNHYIIGSGANEEFENEKYIISKWPDAIGGGADVLTIWPLLTNTIQITCTSHPELNKINYYGSKSDMTRPCKQYQISGNGYEIELYKGMVIELKASDGDTCNRQVKMNKK